MISYGKQSIDQSDIDAIIEVLEGDWLTQGPYVDKFEDSLKSYLGSKYATCVSNGTAALHLTSIALNWNSEDIILTTPITFLATANAIIYANAIPDFVDIDPLTYTIDPNKLEEKLKFYIKKNKIVKAVIAVDYAGHPSDWESLSYLAKKYEFQLINDNCHALGASYKKNLKYAVKYADVVIQSFHPVKNITTGEGGAILSNDQEFNEKIMKLRTHGMTKKNNELDNNIEGPWYYEMHEIGYNYRITDLQCALGINQLKKLDNFINKRRQIAQQYDKYFQRNNLIKCPLSSSSVQHAYHLYPLQIKFEEIKISKKELFRKMKELNICLQVHYIPVHFQPFYKKNYGFKKGDYLEAEKFYSRQVSLPIYPDLSNNEVNHILKSLINIINA